MAEEINNELMSSTAAPPRVNGSASPFPPELMGHKLAVPIMAHGDEVHELKWREPTAGDIERAGNPIKLQFIQDEDIPRMEFDEKKMNAMIGVLSQIPPSSVKQISAGDWQAIAWKMSRFFMPRSATTDAPQQ